MLCSMIFFFKHDISNLHRINKLTGHDGIGQNTDSERRKNHVFIRFKSIKSYLVCCDRLNFLSFLMLYDDFARVFVVRWCYVWFCLNRDVIFKRFIRVKMSWQPIWLQNCMLLYMWINNVNRIFLAIGFIQPMNRTRVFSSHSRLHLSFHLNFWYKEDRCRRIVTITWT